MLQVRFRKPEAKYPYMVLLVLGDVVVTQKDNKATFSLCIPTHDHWRVQERPVVLSVPGCKA